MRTLHKVHCCIWETICQVCWPALLQDKLSSLCPNFKCVQCDVYFVTKNNLYIHMRIFHKVHCCIWEAIYQVCRPALLQDKLWSFCPNLAASIFKCVQCDIYLFTKNYMEAHVVICQRVNCCDERHLTTAHHWSPAFALPLTLVRLESVVSGGEENPPTQPSGSLTNRPVGFNPRPRTKSLDITVHIGQLSCNK